MHAGKQKHVLCAVLLPPELPYLTLSHCLSLQLRNQHAFLHSGMHACMHACMYVCVYVYVCAGMYVCAYACVCMHRCSVYMLACMYVFLCMTVYAYMYACMYGCMHVCTCVCRSACWIHLHMKRRHTVFIMQEQQLAMHHAYRRLNLCIQKTYSKEVWQAAFPARQHD